MIRIKKKVFSYQKNMLHVRNYFVRKINVSYLKNTHQKNVLFTTQFKKYVSYYH